MSRIPPRASLTSVAAGRRLALNFSLILSRVSDICSIALKSSDVEKMRGCTQSRKAIPASASPAATRALMSICNSQSRARFS